MIMATITRANAEFLTIAQCGPLLTAAGMDGTTVDGTNLSLNGPLGRAILDMGGTVVSSVLITDTDMATVTNSNEFLDKILLHALEAVMGNLDDVDITAGPRSEKLSQLALQVERRIKRLWDDRVRLAVPVQGYITKDIAEHD